MLKAKKYVLLMGVFSVLHGLMLQEVDAQQPLLRITSPANGEVVNSNQTITITVSADPALTGITILPESPLPAVQAGPAPNRFLLALSAKTQPRTYQLTAIGISRSGPVYSDPVSIDIERSDDPVELSAEPALLFFDGIGDKHSFVVEAAFADGTSLVVTHSSKIVYVTDNPKVVTVSDGIATATGPGETKILVKAVSVTAGKTLPTFSIGVQVPRGDANKSSANHPSNCSSRSEKGDYARD
jgi:hypothetical protein